MPTGSSSKSAIALQLVNIFLPASVPLPSYLLIPLYVSPSSLSLSLPPFSLLSDHFTCFCSEFLLIYSFSYNSIIMRSYLLKSVSFNNIILQVCAVEYYEISEKCVASRVSSKDIINYNIRDGAVFHDPCVVL